MRARELFSHYRQRVEAMAAEKAPLPAWPVHLGEILGQFEREASSLGLASARLLCEELCDQLEHEALHTTSKHRRDVLMRTVKGLEEIADRRLRLSSLQKERGTTEDSSR
jgi:hypothetical protein